MKVLSTLARFAGVVFTPCINTYLIPICYLTLSSLKMFSFSSVPNSNILQPNVNWVEVGGETFARLDLFIYVLHSGLNYPLHLLD